MSSQSKKKSRAAIMYITAVTWNTVVNDPVFSKIYPEIETLSIPAKEPRVLLSPKSFPAL